MLKCFNNKGYMLVEIILASVIAMIVAYFVIDLTIKLKNKNDDLLVKTVVYTDQAIMYNTIMNDIYNSGNDINCDYIESKINIDKENNVFKYGEFTNVVSEYASIGDYTCEGEGSSIRVNIQMKVKQLPDDNFNVNIDNQSIAVDDTPPVINFDITEKDSKYYAVITCSDDESGIVGDEITEKLLEGSSNVTVEYICTNGVGLTTKSDYVYKYVCKSFGTEVCHTCNKPGGYVCDTWYSANPNSVGCDGIVGCAACHQETIYFKCNCTTPCITNGFIK